MVSGLQRTTGLRQRRRGVGAVHGADLLGRKQRQQPAGGWGMPVRRTMALLLTLLLAPGSAVAQVEAGEEAPLPGTASEVTVTDRGRVEMHVADLPLSTVLQMLSLQGRRNIIASPDVSGTVTANLYNVSFEEALTAILHANGAGYRQLGEFIYVYTEEELAQMALALVAPPRTQVFRLDYISAADAKTYITGLLAEDETVAVSAEPMVGVGSSSDEAGGNSSTIGDFLIVTARAETLRKVERILAELDVRPQQVLLEATILRAELTDDNALGIDFSIVGGVDLQELGAASFGLTDVTTGMLPDARFERFNAIATTDLTGDMSDDGITVGIIKDNVAVFLHALEEVTDTVVLANPKVLALNKQRGQVIVGRRDGFMTTTVTETQAIQTVEFLETGTQLMFRPFIGADGFVRMELHPEDSVGFVNAQGLPSEQTTEVTTNVIVRDGDTILIGGLFREVTTDARSQVPGLGSVPLVGSLFRSRQETTAREEVIILLTVHIVKDHAAYASASHEEYQNIERLRVGLRRGLMWHGRDRLAQMHYRKGWEYFNAGDTEKALWHLDLALHNNARWLAAIQLKEKILQERAWYDDASASRGFLHRLIAQERGDVRRPFGRPGPPFENTSARSDPEDKDREGPES